LEVFAVLFSVIGLCRGVLLRRNDWYVPVSLTLREKYPNGRFRETRGGDGGLIVRRPFAVSRSLAENCEQNPAARGEYDSDIVSHRVKRSCFVGYCNRTFQLETSQISRNLVDVPLLPQDIHHADSHFQLHSAADPALTDIGRGGTVQL
jgi:hypothetical protein